MSLKYSSEYQHLKKKKNIQLVTPKQLFKLLRIAYYYYIHNTIKRNHCMESIRLVLPMLIKYFFFIPFENANQ